MTDQRTLLAEYALHGSEEAFRELVTRYLNLVYGTAVRRVNGDTHLAEDVAQTVFADLARLAGTLTHDVMLGGWLHRRTCHVAASAVRSARRRQDRERQAAAMNIPQDQTEASLAQIAPVLDEAINQLSADDRTAIMLRFFEGRDLRAVGEMLGSNEDAAQKRVARALEKLRGLLGRQGVNASSALLAAVLGAHAVTAAPAGLAASVAGAALASAATSGGLTLALLKFMAMTKLQVTLGAAVVAGLGTTLVLEHQSLTGVRAQNQAMQQQLEQLAGQNEPISTRRALKPRLPAPRLPVSAPAAEPVVDTLRPTNLIARLLNGDDLYRLNLQQVESFLQDNRRSPASLLAAFRATEDPALLQEALEKYPRDPRVSFVACFAAFNRPDSTPEERRLRLEAFKQSAPDNALANYLSAQEHFKSGQTDQAVLELAAAFGKSQFQDYSADFVQNVEEACRAAGRSEAEAKAIASCSLPLPQLAQLRQLGENVTELATLYRKGGDEASAQVTLQMGLTLARQVGEPSGNHGLINDLVALNIESHLLQSIDPARPYDSAGRSVKDRLDELAQCREEIKRLGEPSTWLGGERRDVLVALSERMPPQDLISFFDRVKVSGEMEALRWALNKLGAQK
jgi:RNA polymerase sigma factor (sigma-70 family)